MHFRIYFNNEGARSMASRFYIYSFLTKAIFDVRNYISTSKNVDINNDVITYR